MSFARGGGLTELARTGLCAGLVLAMMTVLIKLRPREGWGVKVGPTALLVSRPTQGQLEVPWSSVREVRRVGTQRSTLALILGDDGRVLLPSHLFATRRQFEAVATAIEERLPRPRWDA